MKLKGIIKRKVCYHRYVSKFFSKWVLNEAIFKKESSKKAAYYTNIIMIED